MRRHTLYFLLLLILAGITIFTVSTRFLVPTAEHERYTVSINDIDRDYHVYFPAENLLSTGTTHPLMLVLAPYGASAEGFARQSRLHAAASTRGFITVYTENTDDFWDDGRFAAGVPPYGTALDDMAYIDSVLDEVAENYTVDLEQVYLVGYRNSGGMVYRLSCDMPGRFQSAAIVSALMWGYMVDNCTSDAVPQNMLFIRGADDPLYTPSVHPYTTFLDFSRSFDILGDVETVAYWQQRIGCNLASMRFDDIGLLSTNTDCPEGVTMAYYEVPGGSDAWLRKGDYQLNTVGIDYAEIIAHFFAGSAAWRTFAVLPEVTDASVRSYATYVPNAYNPETPMPLVVALHMIRANGPINAYITEFNKIAEQEGFIVVYPDALKEEWSYARNMPMAQPNQPDDDTFIRNLLVDLEADFNIDTERIYATGISNGGFMTHRLACTASDRFAAFATVGATGYLGMPNLCSGSAPVPILMIHGTDDGNVFWNGDRVTYQGDEVYLTAPALDTVQFWVRHNGCNEDYELEKLPELGQSPDTHVEILRFSGCQDNADVEFYAIFGAGHNWPGVPGRLPDELAGRVNMDIHASEVIWNFFSQHTLTDSIE